MAKSRTKLPSARATARTPSVRLRSGSTVPLDGDLVFLIDTLYQDLAVRSGFSAGYAEVKKVISALIHDMGPAAANEYFASSLFLNYATYENEMAERLTTAIVAQAEQSRKSKKRARPAGPGAVRKPAKAAGRVAKG